MDNTEDNREREAREACERRETERENRRQAAQARIAERQRRGIENRGLEKGQIDELQHETWNKKDT